MKNTWVRSISKQIDSTYSKPPTLFTHWKYFLSPYMTTFFHFKHSLQPILRSSQISYLKNLNRRIFWDNGYLFKFKEIRQNIFKNFPEISLEVWKCSLKFREYHLKILISPRFQEYLLIIRRTSLKVENILSKFG